MYLVGYCILRSVVLNVQVTLPHDLNHLMRCAGRLKLHHHLNAGDIKCSTYYLTVPLNFGRSNFLEVRLCTVE